MSEHKPQIPDEQWAEFEKAVAAADRIEAEAEKAWEASRMRLFHGDKEIYRECFLEGFFAARGTQRPLKTQQRLIIQYLYGNEPVTRQQLAVKGFNNLYHRTDGRVGHLDELRDRGLVVHETGSGYQLTDAGRDMAEELLQMPR